MTRSRKRPSFKCPEGHSCDWCGPKVARERQEAKAPTQLEFDYEPIDNSCFSGEPECDCVECIERGTE